MIVSVSTGHDTKYLTDQVAEETMDYYTGATREGEPPARWYGQGAQEFGLSGEAREKDINDLFGKFLDPRTQEWADGSGPDGKREGPTLGSAPGKFQTPDEIVAAKLAAQPHALPEEQKAWREAAEKSARTPVKYIDLTLGVPKSVTVLHTAFHRAELGALGRQDTGEASKWAGKRQAVEKAIWEANHAMLDAMEKAAGHVRVSGGDRSGRAQRFMESKGWTVASFFQHDSRQHDPHLHIHNAVLNRVVSADGKVRTLDSKAIHHWKQYAGAVAARVLVEEMASQGIAMQMREDGKAFEVVGVSKEAMDLFSGQSRKLTAKAEQLKETLEAATGQPMNSLQMDRLRRQAEFATRKKKQHEPELRPEMIKRWDQELRTEVGVSLTRIAHQFEDVTPPTAQEPKPEFSVKGVLQEAVAACEEKRAGWTRPELIRQINDRLGPALGITRDQAVPLLEKLADRALNDPDLVVKVAGQPMTAKVPEVLRRTDGASFYDTSVRDMYVSRENLRAEELIRQQALKQGFEGVSPTQVTEWLKAHPGVLRPDQEAAVRGIACSQSGISVLAAAAGTGKTYSAAVLDRMMSETTGGRVFGLTISQVAATILKEEGVRNAANTSAWLGLQKSIAEGSPFVSAAQWLPTKSDVLMVDEASMLDTKTFSAIREIAERTGCRIAVTGDPAQLSAVRAGGMYAFLANEVNTFTLMDVRRMEQEWERSASLGLRDGDESAVRQYERRGRLYDSGTIEEARAELAQFAVADRLLGKSSVVVTPSNEEASLISAEVRRTLVDMGLVEEGGVALEKDGNLAGVGDIVACRQNDYDAGVLNRRQYEVLEVINGGGMRLQAVDGSGERVVAGEYVKEHVSLGYAGTAHSVQGMTVDRSRGLITEQTDRAGAYIPLSRGKELNTAHCVTVTVQDLAGKENERMTAGSVLRNAVERDNAERAGLTIMQDYRDHMKNMATVMAYTEDATRVACRARLDNVMDRLTEQNVLTEVERASLGNDKATEGLSRLLHSLDQAGINSETALRAAIQERDLGGADSVAQVLHHRLTQALPDGKVPDPIEAARTPQGLTPDVEEYLDNLHEIAGDRRRELGQQVATERPEWALRSWGPVPEDAVARAEWEHKAGIVAAQRESKGWDNPEVAMGPRSGVSSTEQRALDHAAWDVLGRPDAYREEADLSVGALRNRVKAEESMRSWAPPFVDAELEAAYKAAAVVERDNTLAGTGEAHGRDYEDARFAVAGLEEAIAERDKWLAYQETTKAVADRAREELAQRGEPAVGEEPDRVTAQEWLAEEARTRREDDAFRVIHEADLHRGETGETVDAPRAEKPEPVTTSGAVTTREETDRIVQAAREAYDREADYRSQDAAYEASTPVTLPVVKREERQIQHDDQVREMAG